MSDQTWDVTVPGSVLDAGIGLGLLNPGDNVPGSVTPAVFATNTVEGTKTAAPVAFTLGPITASPVTGLADPVSTSFSVPDMTWTSVGGTVALSMDQTTVQVSIGAIDLDFTCVPTGDTPFVQTEVLGSTGQPPAGRPTPGTDPAVQTVIVTVSTPTSTDTLPKTGAAILAPILLALGLIDLGYLANSAAAPARRRQTSA